MNCPALVIRDADRVVHIRLASMMCDYRLVTDTARRTLLMCDADRVVRISLAANVAQRQPEIAMIREDAKWIGYRRFELRCLQCGELFQAARSDAKYCKPGCRKAAGRRKEQLRRAATDAINQIEVVKRYMKLYPECEYIGAIELERIASTFDDV